MLAKSFRIRARFVPFYRIVKPFSVNNDCHVSYPEKKISIKTCRDKGGVDIPVSYIDTGNGTDQATAFFIHGTPGDYSDYHNQIPYLTQRNVRVIVPTFPEYSFVHKTNRKYRHKMEDRSNFASDFLKAINISKIDMLVGHSSGVYPCLHLFCTKPVEIGALALVNPAMHMEAKVINPAWFYRGLVYAGSFKPSYYVMKKFLFPLMQKLAPVRLKDIDHPLLVYTSILTSTFEDIQRLIRTVKLNQKPSLLIFSANDKTVEMPVYKDMLKILSIDERDVFIYNDQNELKLEGINVQKSWIKAIKLETGTHYSIWKRPGIVNEALIELISKTK